jgi:formylmethanofuran dehydrogenase subunit C
MASAADVRIASRNGQSASGSIHYPVVASHRFDRGDCPMPLVLRYHGQTSIPVEVPGIVPGRVREQSLEAIRRMSIFHGNEELSLAELFDASGEAGDETIIWEGDLAGVHRLGQNMDGGRMHIAGTAGRHLGSEMTAGRIDVGGSAGDWLGGQMRGGLIHVRGDAGNLVGAAYRGDPRGMTGGTILVDGSAGSELGRRMRRGLIAVGAAADAAAADMIAGSVLVMGCCGRHPGANMRRGTIGIFTDQPPPLLPTFRYGCRCRPVMMRMLLGHLRQLDYAIDEGLLQHDCALYHGDLLAGGRGELLLVA